MENVIGRAYVVIQIVRVSSFGTPVTLRLHFIFKAWNGNMHDLVSVIGWDNSQGDPGPKYLRETNKTILNTIYLGGKEGGQRTMYFRSLGFLNL